MKLTTMTVDKGVRVIFLTCCITFILYYLTGTTTAYAYNMYSTVNIDDTAIHTKIPITRSNYKDILSTAKSLGYYTGTEEELSKPATRAIYATIFNRVAEKTNTPKLECCMGTNPDFSDLKEGQWYTDEFKQAATNGYLCTRDGSRAEEYITYKEFDKMLYKMVNSMEWKSNHNTFSTDIFKKTLIDNNPELAEQPEAYLEILCELFVNDMLPITSDGKLRLNEPVTKYDLVQWAVAYTDLKVIEHLVLTGDNICTSCLFTDIQPWYNKIQFPLDNSQKR